MSQTSLAKVKKGELVNYDKLDLIGEILRLRDSIVNLGDGQMLVKRSDTGVIRAVKQEVHLREEFGEIQKIGGKTMITGPGAIRLNQTPGLNIITPATINVDGQQRCNPYPEKNPKTKVIQTVTTTKIVFGPNPLGNMVGVNYTLFYNIHTYFLQDLQAKIKKHPACGYLGTNIDGKPAEKYMMPGKKWKEGKKGKNGYYIVDEDPAKAKEHKTNQTSWAFYEIDEAANVPIGLWVDISHPEIIACYDSHVQRQKFGERHAQTICTRNALLLHPAIAAKTVIATGDTGKMIAKVPVYGWKHDLNVEKISKMADDITTGKKMPDSIDIIDIKEEVQYEDLEKAGVDNGDEFGATPEQSEQSEPSMPKVQKTPATENERDDLIMNIYDWVENHGGGPVGDAWFVSMREKYNKNKGHQKMLKWPGEYSNEDIENLIILFKKESK